MKKLKLILGGLAVLLVALLGGFIWGTTGKTGLQEAVRLLELRSDLLEARGFVLAARLDVYNANFGDSSGNLEDARTAVERAAQRFRAVRREAEAMQLETALPSIREAQQLAGKLDLAAGSRAAEVGKIIDGLLQTVPRP